MHRPKRKPPPAVGPSDSSTVEWKRIQWTYRDTAARGRVAAASEFRANPPLTLMPRHRTQLIAVRQTVGQRARTASAAARRRLARREVSMKRWRKTVSRWNTIKYEETVTITLTAGRTCYSMSWKSKREIGVVKIIVLCGFNVLGPRFREAPESQCTEFRQNYEKMSKYEKISNFIHSIGQDVFLHYSDIFLHFLLLNFHELYFKQINYLFIHS